MNIPQIPLDFDALIPELILTAFASIILLMGLLRINKSILVWTSVLFLTFIIPIFPVFEGKAFGEMFLNDFLAIYLKIIIVTGTIISILLLSSYLNSRLILLKESIALMIFAATGMMLLISSRELISFFVSLEMMSLS
ncbi:MAG: hypothetical protein N3A56_08280, partial [Thermodesulfobacteriaceae bacterium]|nr:hypothetical protein [Thermodesulfobacteriaceae bacterium]